MRRVVPLVLLLGACGDDGAGGGDASADGGGTDAPALAADAIDLDGLSCGASPLVLLAPEAPVTGSTVGAADQTAGTCGGTTAGEAYYVISVPARADVLLSTEGEATDFDAAVSLRAACLDAASELGCASSGALGDALLVRDVAPGLYYVIVDGVAGTQGAFSLALRFRPLKELGDACDPSGDVDRCADGLRCEGAGTPVCADPFAATCMTATAAGSGEVVSGTLAGASALEPSCGPGGAEALYQVDLSGPGFLYAIEQGGALAGGATLSVRGPESCNPAYDLLCDGDAGGLRVLTAPLAAGRYYLIIDGSGDYQLALTVGENLAAGLTCDPASTSARCDAGLFCLSGECQPVLLVDDVSPNASFCDAQGPYPSDLVVNGRLTTGGSVDVDTYRVELATTGSLEVETSDGMGGCAVDTLVEIFAKGASSCGSLDGGMPAPIASDDDSGPAGGCSRLTAGSLAPGAYYVRVRRGGSAAGAYVLSVDLQ